MSRTRTGILAAVGTESFYGLSYVVTRSALDDAAPAVLLAWRFGLALLAVLVLVAAGAIRLTITRRTLPWVLLLGALDPVAYYVCETIGIARTSASVSGLVLAAIPVACLVASAVLGSLPSTRQVVGVVVTLAGVCATVLAGGASGDGSAPGYLALVGAVIVFALYTVAAERITVLTSADKTLAMILVGGIAFPVHGLATQSSAALVAPVHHPAVLVAVLVLVLGCTLGAYALQNVAIESLGATAYGTFIGISTVVALVAGRLVLGERLGVLQLGGGALILVGVYAANGSTRTRGEPERS